MDLRRYIVGGLWNVKEKDLRMIRFMAWAADRMKFTEIGSTRED